jgi:predicted double-glycine peptidase
MGWAHEKNKEKDMIRPSFMKQIDSRWASKRYRTSDGGYPSVGGAGCGPACVANVINALTKGITPLTVFKYACKKGYMTANSGTYWSGIPAMLKHYGIKTVETLPHNSEGKKKLKAYLKKNYWAINIMGPGTWTRGGHYILAYYVDSNDNVYISDPASYAENRAKNTFNHMWNEQRQAWVVIDPNQYKNHKPKKDTKTVTLYVSDDVGRVRVGANKEKKLVAILKKNTKLKLKHYKGDWYEIVKGKYKGKFISKKHLSKYINEDKKYKSLYTMNVRDGYTTKADLVGSLAKGKTVSSTKQRGNWAYFPSLNGWVCIKDKNQTYLKVVK